MTDTVSRLMRENEQLRNTVNELVKERERLRATLRGYSDSDLASLAAWYVARAELADLIGPDDAAIIIGVSRRRVLDFIAADRIEAVNLGGEGRSARYVLRREDVEAFAAQQRKDGRPPKAD